MSAQNSSTEPGYEPAIRVIAPECQGARIRVRIEPEGILLSMPRVKTARQLLVALNLAEESALVARARDLLTPDRRIWPNDELLVRVVSSRG